MYGKLAKAVLITTGAFWMFPLAVETGKFAVVIAVAAALLVWFLWAVWRVIVLCRARAFRTDAEPWQREAFGFAAGILIATPALVLLLGNVLEYVDLMSGLSQQHRRRALNLPSICITLILAPIQARMADSQR